MRRYFDTFGVDSGNYNHELYFQPPTNTGRWFSPSACKEHPRPLCVSMLVRSARAKRWLYDIHFLIEQLRGPDAPLNPARPEENRLRPARRRRHRCATHSR
ncbi:DUF1493 family protein [Serratia ureilytica]